MPSPSQSIRTGPRPGSGRTRTVGLAFAAMFASAPGQSFLIAVFLDAVLADTDLSRTAFSALYGLSLREAGAALGFFGLAGGAGTLAAGALADHVSTRALLAAMSGLLATGSGLLLLPSAAVAYVGLAALGRSGGLFGVASGIAWARTYGLRRLGRIQGTSFSAQIAAAAGPLPLAVSLALAGGYDPALVALTAYAGAGLAVARLWREPLP